MKREPPEIGDVRTWTATCPYCGRPSTYHGMYEGEHHAHEACERAYVQAQRERAAWDRGTAGYIDLPAEDTHRFKDNDARG